MQAQFRFDGVEYDHARDSTRLSGQILRIYDLMKDGRWRTLRMISDFTNTPEASASAHLRSLRKDRFGGHTVNRRHVREGLFEYQLIPSEVK